MYQVKINEKNFEFTRNEEKLLLDGEPFQWDLVKISGGYFHIIYKDKSYTAEVVKADRVAKSFHLKINNKVQVVEVKDKFDLLLDKMGMTSSASAKINNIKAPMPGLVIDMKVKVGDSVNVGDALLILEAMKMENILKATAGAVVKQVKVKKGDSVEKGQVLIEF